MDNLIIRSKEYRELQLRSIGVSDLEELRLWKNSNKLSFFFQEEITSAMQQRWFQKYLASDSGYMFVVEEIMVDSNNNHKIGCMGYRKMDDGEVDIYNIIRGEKSLRNQKMSNAMNMMLSFISIWEANIYCKVLKNNPARDWYLNIGFEISEVFDSYLLLRPRKNVSCDILIEKIKRG